MAAKDYCGIIFIGGGSSWSWAPTVELAAQQAAKTCKRDWKSMFKFAKRHEFTVNVYDMREHDGWVADTVNGVCDSKTHEQLKPLQVVKVTV